MTKSKIEISQIEKHCERLNATVPYPKSFEENQNYRDAFDSMNISTPVAVKSCHGIVELESTLKWNPFPTEMMVNAVCEKTVALSTARFKRQAVLGTCTQSENSEVYLYSIEKKVNFRNNECCV